MPAAMLGWRPAFKNYPPGGGLFVYFPIASRNVVFGIILVIVYMIIAGHIIWLIEREEDGPFHKKLPPGRCHRGLVDNSSRCRRLGYCDVYPKKPLSKAFCVLRY